MYQLSGFHIEFCLFLSTKKNDLIPVFRNVFDYRLTAGKLLLYIIIEFKRVFPIYLRPST